MSYIRITADITEKETVPEVSSKQCALCGKCYFIHTSETTWDRTGSFIKTMCTLWEMLLYPHFQTNMGAVRYLQRPSVRTRVRR